MAKKEGIPIQLVAEGTPGASVVAVKRVNELDFYSLGAKQLTEKLGVSMPKALAAVEHFGVRDMGGCYKEFKLGSQLHKRYSPKALDVIRDKDAGGCVTVRLRPGRYVPPQRVAHDLSERQRRVLALLEASPAGVALREVRGGLGGEVPEWAVKEDLALLKRLGLVDKKGHGRGAYWFFLNQGVKREFQ